MDQASPPRTVRRVAQVIELPPEHEEEYLELHRSVWPEVLATLSRAHVRNYSIYHYGQLLFSYFEYTGHDYAADMAALAADPATQRWWAVCKPLQRQTVDAVPGEWWTPAPEVFHLD